MFLVTSCGNPGTIRRGYFIGSDFSIGSTVEYKCARGYKLHGPAISICKKHGTWTAQPECVGMLLNWYSDVTIIVSAGMSASIMCYGEKVNIEGPAKLLRKFRIEP